MNFFFAIAILTSGIIGIAFGYVSMILLTFILFYPDWGREYVHALKISIIICVLFSALTFLGCLLIE